MLRRSPLSRGLAAALGCASILALATATGTAAHATDPVVHIVKGTTGPSCTGYSSQLTPPSAIRVLVHGATPAATKVVTVPFEDYVENTLPNEWAPSWNAAAVEAGAVAVKSYAWYWVVHYGGYLTTPSNCFDVTDDGAFQIYRANSAQPRTTNAVEATWGVVARMNGQVLQATYACSLPLSGSIDCAKQGGTEKCGAGATGSELSQYGSQACAKLNESYQTILSTYYFPNLELAATMTAGQARLLVPNDFNLQGHSNIGVFTPATGTWTINGESPVRLGGPGDIPTVTNAGDGVASVGVFRPANGTWYLSGSASGPSSVPWGTSGDIPVQAHYRGISQPSVLAVFRPSSGRWFELGVPSIGWGTAGDIPVPGHYAGSSANDYADTPAVFRPSVGRWYVYGGGPSVGWGVAGDIPTPGDYDGNGTTDFAVYRPSVQRWYIRGSASVQWGRPGDIPVTGDFNGDGKTDIAVYRPSTGAWYVRGQATVVFGSATDIPIGRAPLSD